VTRLRKLMLDELQRRNYAQNTVRAYIYAIEDFAKYFHRSPDRLGPEHIREYQVHLFRDCKLSAGTIEGRTAALRFLLVKTLRRPYLPDHIPFPKRQRRMPTVLSQEEVARLIASAQNLMHRTMLMISMRPVCDALNYASSRSAISTANAWSFMFVRARAAVTATSC
jgi:integrase/recombinase XerD